MKVNDPEKRVKELLEIIEVLKKELNNQSKLIRKKEDENKELREALLAKS